MIRISEESDIKTKMDLAKRVLEYSTQNMHNIEEGEVINFDPGFLDETGVNNLRRSIKLRSHITYNDLLHYRDCHPVIQSGLTTSQYRHLLKRYYLTENVIPTMKDLDHQGGSISKAFVLKPLPGLTKGLIVEDPELVYKRMIYLKKIEQLRKSSTHIIYVNHKNFGIQFAREGDADLFIAVSSQSGLMKAFYFSEDEGNISRWLLDCVATINGPCVVIMEEQDGDQIPTASSCKAEMSSWLTANGITHDPKAHRGELYELIKKLKQSENFSYSKVDAVLTALGHQVLRFPKYMEELNFFRMIPDQFCEAQAKDLQMKKENSVTRTINRKRLMITFLKSIDMNKWKQYEKELIDTELLMYQEDMCMEKIVDNLSMMVEDGEAPEELLENLVDTADWGKMASAFIIE